MAQKRSRFIGFIFQFHFLMEDFTAQENVMIPMRRLGELSDNEMRERLLNCWKRWAWATNCADPAVIFREANNSVSLSRAHWRTIRE